MLGAETMPQSVADLLARCQVAVDQELYTTSTDPRHVILSLGLPIPCEARNADLDALKPIYLELLRKDFDLSPYLTNNTTKKPEASILMAYFLEFPIQVRGARGDVTGAAKCTNTEVFTFADVCDGIVKHAYISKWSRNVVANSQYHNSLVLGMCVNMLICYRDLNIESAS